MIKKIPFTQVGYDSLCTELESLYTERISAIAELQRSRELGDLSENSAYRVARQKVTRIDKRIKHIKNLIKYATIIIPKNKNNIDMGSSFSISLNNQVFFYTLVNTFESNIEKGLLSAYSPIGKNMLGKKKGDVVLISTPKGPITCTIVDIK